MFNSLRILAVATGSLLTITGVTNAQQLTVDINHISDTGVGDKIGTVCQ